MNKYTKAASILLILALCLGMLAACGDEGGEGSDAVFSKGLTKEGYFDLNAHDYVTLEDYSKIVVNGDELQYYKDYLLSQYPEDEKEITDRAADYYDTVVINYVGYRDGVPFDGGTAVDQEVTIGVDSYIEGFLESIVGHMPGDTYTVDLTFPSDYHNADLAGVPVQFEITLDKIKEYVYANEMTDEFVKEKLTDYNWSSVEDMEHYLKLSAAYGKIESGAVISEVPESMVDYFVETYVANQIRTAESYSMTLDEMLDMYGLNESDLRDQYRSYAEDYAKEALIYQAIAEDNKVKITNEDLRNYFKELTGNSYYTEFKKQYGMPHLKNSVLRTKVEEIIYSHIVDE